MQNMHTSVWTARSYTIFVISFVHDCGKLQHDTGGYTPCKRRPHLYTNTMLLLKVPPIYWLIPNFSQVFQGCIKLISLHQEHTIAIQSICSA